MSDSLRTFENMNKLSVALSDKLAEIVGNDLIRAYSIQAVHNIDYKGKLGVGFIITQDANSGDDE